jgi:hypothetical protein
MPQAMFEDNNERVFELRSEESSSLFLFQSKGVGVLPQALEGRFTSPKFAKETWESYLKTSAIEKKDMRLKENQELKKLLPATSKKAPPQD